MARLGASGSGSLRRLPSPQSLTGRRSISKVTHVAVGQFLLALEKSVPQLVGPSLGQPTTWRLASLSASEQPGRHTGLCNLILAVTSPHFCCILFIRTESLGLAQLQGERVTLACEHQRKAFLHPRGSWLALKIKLTRTD